MVLLVVTISLVVAVHDHSHIQALKAMREEVDQQLS